MKVSKYNFIFPFDQHYSLVYNALSRSIVLLENEYASEISSGRLIKTLMDDELVRALKDLYVILDDNADEKALFKYFSYSLRFSKDSLLLFLSLTSRCNLACVYCYQSYRSVTNGNDLTIDKWSLIKRFIEKRLREGSREIDVALFGGEPLLNINITRIVLNDLNKLAKEHEVGLHVTLVTNGTIVDNAEDVFHGVNTIQVTIDGVMEVHDKRRPFKNGTGSFEIILKNTFQFIDKYHKQIVVRVNVDEHNVDRVMELIDFLDKHGLRDKIDSIDFSPVVPDQAGRYRPFKGGKTYGQYYRDILRNIVEIVEYASSKGFSVVKNFVIGPCSCRSPSGFSIDEQLRVYRCPALLYEKPEGLLRSDGSVEYKSLNWIKSIVEDPQCMLECKYAPLCFGGCVYLRSRGIPSCVKALFGEELLGRILHAYVKSRYRGLLENAGARYNG